MNDMPLFEEENIVRPRPGLAKKELVAGLIIVALLFSITLISQQNSLTGFFIGPLAVQEDGVGETVEAAIEILTEENITTEQTIPLEPVVEVPVESPSDNLLTGMAVKTEEKPVQILHGSNQFTNHLSELAAITDSAATGKESMLFDGKNNEYVYTAPTDLKGLFEISISFRTKEDFVYAPSELVSATILLYNKQEQLIQTQTFSYNHQGILIQESATGVNILSRTVTPEGEWRRIELEIELAPELDISAAALMFSSDSPEVVKVQERHVFIEGVALSVS